MSDFIVSFDKNYPGSYLLNYLQKHNNSENPEGEFFEYPWGNLAVLKDTLSGKRNIYLEQGILFAWVGDLVMPITNQSISSLIVSVNCIMNGAALQSHWSVLSALNGAFAILIADNNSLLIITDPMGYTQVFLGKKTFKNYTYIFIGTSSQVLSSVSKNYEYDHISLAEFLISGTSTFPYSNYRSIKELYPGTIYKYRICNGVSNERSLRYWSPPPEDDGISEAELANSLRNALISSLQDRIINSNKIGVCLSGGMDSRLIMALIPDSKECIGFTLCDSMNRETITAKRVAECYARSWYPVFRNSEYLANCLLETVKIIGCDFDWINAHTIAASGLISQHNIDVLLNGTEFDVYFKGYFAHEFRRCKRLFGLGQPYYEKVGFNCEENDVEPWRTLIRKSLFTDIMLRRESFRSFFYQENRSSLTEWFKLYPFSQDKIGACWAAERRILPQKFIAMDRRVLEIAFRCPTRFKLNNRLFSATTYGLWGAGKAIPLANNGVRPESGRISFVVQRSVRKAFDYFDDLHKYFGHKRLPQHSWHDYQNYWSHNLAMRKLVSRYGCNLDELNNILFCKSGLEIINIPHLRWDQGFRLLQLAVWLGVNRDLCT